MYDHDPEEVESLGWEEFIARQWESIFTGYRSWTGLRTMAPDGLPVVGYDPEAPGFFWLAGQGGYGIQTSAALAEMAKELILTEGKSSGTVPSAVAQALSASR